MAETEQAETPGVQKNVETYVKKDNNDNNDNNNKTACVTLLLPFREPMRLTSVGFWCSSVDQNDALKCGASLVSDWLKWPAASYVRVLQY